MIKVLKRYSSDSQDAIQQTVTIDRYLNHHNIIPDEVIEESEHGDVPFMDRELGRTIMKCEEGDKIIVSEYTRLNRGSMLDNFLMLEVIKLKGVVLHAIRENATLTGSTEDEMKVFMYAKSSALELINIKARTSESYIPIKKQLKETGEYFTKKTKRIITSLGNTTNLAVAQKLANVASIEARRNKALKNTKLKQAWMTANLLKRSGLKNTQIVNQLNSSGYKTLSGGNFSTKNIARFIRTYSKIYDGEIQIKVRPVEN